MRNHLIESLRVARALVGNGIVLDRCPFRGRHSSASEVCRSCHHSMSCQWVCDIDDNASLSEKTTDELVEALDYAVEYAVSLALQNGHYWNSCSCECCSWIRSSGKLLRGFDWDGSGSGVGEVTN